MHDSDTQLIRSAARRVALTITLAVSALVVAVLIAAFAVVFTQIPLPDLLNPQQNETVVDIQGLDIIVGGVSVGLIAIALAGLLGWLVTRRAVRPLVDALRRQRQFVADASHELRTPLAVLDARIQLLQRSSRASDPHQELVTQLRQDALSVIGVVSDLLHAAEVPTGSPAESTPVATCVTSAVSAMSLLAREREVRLISTPIAPDLSAAIPDPSLRRSLIALLDNAIKHSPVGTAVTVSASQIGGRVHIDVTDEGPGIQGIAPDRVFDRFARSADAVDGGGSSRTGFGIGLSLVQDTLSRYGGSAQVSSSTDEGTTMTLTIPLPRRRAGLHRRPVRDAAWHSR
ncbi:sensor histidine kinase [Microbacterium sp. T32]|uniref:sensor histidine kinase n=2 Tax=Bacillati TaxID=1783272 RepID=UPI001E4FDDDB|nr:HAMP domain-containing sensor histidine kinase [Microbacterium sp. T32]